MGGKRTRDLDTVNEDVSGYCDSRKKGGGVVGIGKRVRTDCVDDEKVRKVGRARDTKYDRQR